MPEELRRNLHEEALKHGFKPGSERYNRFVFITNHSGALSTLLLWRYSGKGRDAGW